MSVTLQDRDGRTVFQGTQSGISASTPGAARVLGPFPIAFNTIGLASGHAIYTPTVGDILLNVWVEVVAAWNGTTPKLDIGNATQLAAFGLFAENNAPYDMTHASVDIGIAVSGQGITDLATSNIEIGSLVNSGTVVPGRFTSASPLLVCVSQDGTTVGSSPGASQGSANVYLVVATPSTT